MRWTWRACTSWNTSCNTRRGRDGGAPQWTSAQIRRRPENEPALHSPRVSAYRRGFEYFLEQTQAARLIGIKLATPDVLRVNKNGFQKAVSPPEANKWFFGLLALLVDGIGWLVVGFGWRMGLARCFAAVAAGVFAQVLFLPKRHSQHCLLQIFGSMSRRYANYERDGDREGASAMRYLLGRIAEGIRRWVLPVRATSSTSDPYHTAGRQMRAHRARLVACGRWRPSPTGPRGAAMSGPDDRACATGVAGRSSAGPPSSSGRSTGLISERALVDRLREDCRQSDHRIHAGHARA